MNQVYMIEYVIEKKDGTVRFESIEYPLDKNISRFRPNPKLRKGETMIRFTAQLCDSLV